MSSPFLSANWWIGPNSLLGKLFGRKPAPTPVPPTPVPVPTPMRAVAVVAVPGAAITLRFSNSLSGVGNNPDGYCLFTPVPDQTPELVATVEITANGYQPYSAVAHIAPGNQNLICGQQIPALVKVAPPVPKWTKAQLMDFQGDLMIFAPEIPQPSIYKGGARGLDSGWHWTLNLPFYSDADRQRLYAKIRDFYHFTHVAIQGCATAVGGGYHDLFPITDAAHADSVDIAIANVHQELLDAGLIPVVAGVAPGPAAQGGAEVNPHLNVTKVLIAISDWDNTSFAAERIKKISDTFPNALLYYERPGDRVHASGITKSPNDPVDASWDISNGGAWIGSMQRLCPRFTGVLYEVNNWTGDSADPVATCTAELKLAHTFWRDVQQVRFETNTYDKFWSGNPPSAYDGLEASLAAQNPQLVGFMSGGSAHAIVVSDPGTTADGGAVGDMIPVGDITFVGGPNVGTWPATAKITRLELRATQVYVEFTKQDGANSWPDIPFGNPGDSLQYSMGLVYQVGGKWYGSAPIELWRGLKEGGGPIQTQDIGDGRGQIIANWFYDGRWAPLNQRNPVPGETVGFYVAAGDLRNSNFAVAERSNIVSFPLPKSGQTMTLTWQA